MADKAGAVVTGGDFQGLGLMRTLARKDIPVFLLDDCHCIGKYSRFKKKFARCPKPSEEESFVGFLVELAEREKLHGWVLFPNSDEAVYVLSKNKDLLEKYYRVTTPGWEVIRNVYVKKETYQLAEKNGIPIPRTYFPRDLNDLIEMNVHYPVVIKPSIRDHYFSKVKVKAYLVNSGLELIKTYRKVSSVIDPSEILVQEFIPGGPRHLYSFCPFFKDRKVVLGVMARRLRQHPMDFGHATTYAETVDIPEMRAIAEKFLGLIDYYGIAEVEFMNDPRDGTWKLIEVNPRVWGWHTLAIAAGADLPYLLYRDMLGEELEADAPLRHMKWVRLVTDIPTVFLEIARGRMKISEYLRSMKGQKEYAVFSKDDPLPFFAEIAMLPYLWIKRGF